VIDLGLSTTPTVEIAVPLEKADGELFLPPLITEAMECLKIIK
jgi:hypothetical protein